MHANRGDLRDREGSDVGMEKWALCPCGGCAAGAGVHEAAQKEPPCCPLEPRCATLAYI